MPISRSPSSASATMARYLGSKMCSGSCVAGKSTTLGSGKRGISDGSMSVPTIAYGPSPMDHGLLVNRPRLLVHIVHQHVLSQRVWRREVGLAAADFGDSADEGDQ